MTRERLIEAYNEALGELQVKTEMGTFVSGYIASAVSSGKITLVDGTVLQVQVVLTGVQDDWISTDEDEEPVKASKIGNSLRS